MIERILQIIDYKGINKSIFYKNTGLSNGFLDKVKDIGASKLELILNTYPEIDMEWLLTGQGSMLKSDAKKEEKPPPEVSKIDDLNQLRKENAMQAKIIAGLEFQVATLEKEVYMYKITQGDPIVNEIVARPAPELITEKHK